MYKHSYTFIYTYGWGARPLLLVGVWIYMYICVFIYLYMYIFVYTHIYVYMYIYFISKRTRGTLPKIRLEFSKVSVLISLLCKRNARREINKSQDAWIYHLNKWVKISKSQGAEKFTPKKEFLHCATHWKMLQESMGWLRLEGCLELDVSFAEYSLFYGALLQKRPKFLRSLQSKPPHTTHRISLQYSAKHCKKLLWSFCQTKGESVHCQTCYVKKRNETWEPNIFRIWVDCRLSSPYRANFWKFLPAHLRPFCHLSSDCWNLFSTARAYQIYNSIQYNLAFKKLHSTESSSWELQATISRLLKMIGIFCKRAL